MAKYYEKKKEGYCPKCGKQIFDWNGSVIDGNEVIFYFTCGCGLAGSEFHEVKYSVTTGDDATSEEIEAGWDISMSE